MRRVRNVVGSVLLAAAALAIPGAATASAEVGTLTQARDMGWGMAAVDSDQAAESAATSTPTPAVTTDDMGWG